VPVTVEIPTILRPLTDGAKTVAVAGQTLGEVIDALNSAHPGIAERIVEAATVRRFVNIYLNDEDVRFLDGLATPVADDDVVTVLPAVAGGQTERLGAPGNPAA